MGARPELAFDVCWEVYKNCREVLESKRGVGALNLEDVTKYLWRPDIRPRIGEFVADFALSGKSALKGPEHASRLLLFRLYYHRGDSPPLRPGAPVPRRYFREAA